MNVAHKREFCRELIGRIQEDILLACERTPEEWDGIELRQYIADKFAEKAGTMSSRRETKRLRKYRNEVLVRNL